MSSEPSNTKDSPSSTSDRVSPGSMIYRQFGPVVDGLLDQQLSENLHYPLFPCPVHDPERDDCPMATCLDGMMQDRSHSGTAAALLHLVSGTRMIGTQYQHYVQQAQAHAMLAHVYAVQEQTLVTRMSPVLNSFLSGRNGVPDVDDGE